MQWTVGSGGGVLVDSAVDSAVVVVVVVCWLCAVDSAVGSAVGSGQWWCVGCVSDAISDPPGETLTIHTP